MKRQRTEQTAEAAATAPSKSAKAQYLYQVAWEHTSWIDEYGEEAFVDCYDQEIDEASAQYQKEAAAQDTNGVSKQVYSTLNKARIAAREKFRELVYARLYENTLTVEEKYGDDEDESETDESAEEDEEEEEETPDEEDEEERREREEWNKETQQNRKRREEERREAEATADLPKFNKELTLKDDRTGNEICTAITVWVERIELK